MTFSAACIAVGCLLGAWLVGKTYSAINELPEFLIEMEKDAKENSQGLPEESNGYDWDQYDEYLKPPEDDKGGEPEA